MKLRKIFLIPSLIFTLLVAPLYAQLLVNLPDFTPIVEKEGKVVVNISTTSRVQQGGDFIMARFIRCFVIEGAACLVVLVLARTQG